MMSRAEATAGYGKTYVKAAKWDKGRILDEVHCCIDGSPRDGEGGGMKRNRRPRPPVQAPSVFAGFQFPPGLLAVR